MSIMDPISCMGRGLVLLRVIPLSSDGALKGINLFFLQQVQGINLFFSKCRYTCWLPPPLFTVDACSFLSCGSYPGSDHHRSWFLHPKHQPLVQGDLTQSLPEHFDDWINSHPSTGPKVACHPLLFAVFAVRGLGQQMILSFPLRKPVQTIHEHSMHRCIARTKFRKNFLALCWFLPISEVLCSPLEFDNLVNAV